MQPDRPRITVPAVEIPAQRRLPPFGREVIEELAAGRTPNVYLFTGPKAWDRASERRFKLGRGSAIVMPADTPPEAIRWPIVDALCMVCYEIGRAEAVEIARAVVSAGVRSVVALGHDGFIVRSAPPRGRAA